jgi:hypothetical protein
VWDVAERAGLHCAKFNCFPFLRAVSDIDGYCDLQYLFTLNGTDFASWSNIRPHSSEVAKM